MPFAHGLSARERELGGNVEHVARRQADRASLLSLPQLAAEVMTKAFTMVTPLRTWDGSYLSLGQLVARFAPGVRLTDAELYQRFSELVGEGLQVLEHASLVRYPVESSGVYCYGATRLGRAALEQGAVERVIAGGGL
jgi:hypothetical protein